MCTLLQRKALKFQYFQKRNFWAWINMMFNRPDVSRIKEVGPDRACAEWLLRNGGSVQWIGAKEPVCDYNSLSPIVDTSLFISTIDATDSSISHYGFGHLRGCKHIDKIILHNCSYIEDKALIQLSNIDSPLKYLQISTCLNVTDKGLKGLPKIDSLNVLNLNNLPEVKNMKECEEFLHKLMPNCKMEIYNTKNKCPSS